MRPSLTWPSTRPRITPTWSVQPTLLQPTITSPLNCRLRCWPAARSVSSTCSPPGTPCQSPKLVEIRPSVSSTLICVTPLSAAPLADHVQRGDVGLVGGVGLDGADDGLAADLVEGLGAVAGGVDAGHAGLHVLVGQHALQALDAASPSGSRCSACTPVALMTRSASSVWPLDSLTFIAPPSLRQADGRAILPSSPVGRPARPRWPRRACR